MKISNKKYPGFTIVELLIVIVVIAVLAAITIVAFNGVSKRAYAARVQSSLRNFSAAMETERVENGSYPLSIPSSFKQDSGVTVTYTSGDATSYCVDAVAVGNTQVTYFINSQSSKTPQSGTCSGGSGSGPTLTLPASVMANMRLRLEAKNITQADNTMLSSWTDMSGTNHSASASGSPLFRDQSGEKYVDVSSSNSFSTSSLGISGSQARHIFALVRSSTGGTILGFGSASNGNAYDLWHYNNDSLIWHGYGGGYDTIGNAPNMGLGSWYLIESSYSGSTVTVRINGGSAYTRSTSLNTLDSTFKIGYGNYANYWNGSVKSVLVFSQELSSTDAQTVRNYLTQQ